MKGETMMGISVISLLVSMAALWVAGRGKPTGTVPAKAPLPPKSVQQRQQQAVARKEWENFMSYDGSEQAPIDPDRVLGE